VISPKLSEGQAHLEYKALAVGRFIGSARADNPKQKAYSSLSVMTLRGSREEKTEYCTECVSKLRQFS
jgi:hypothetical protein